ncbi:MAG: hypothetical protein ACTMHH_04160 [Nesterenkonia sp.]
MHHVTPAPQTLGTRSRLPAAALTGLTLVGLAALSACSAGVTDPPTSAGASQASSTEAAQPETSRSSEPQEQQTASEELVALTPEQMMDVLISPSDLSAVPEGHSTHSGSNYFHEEIAVEFQDYRDRFGTSECTTTMDSINVDLVGEGAEDGLMHMYSFTSSDGEEQTGLLYVWMLAYDRPINTSPVWSAVGEHCTGTQLQNGADSVDVATFDAGDFTGVQLGIHGDSEEFTTFSASVDAGENLVMMSSVGLEEERFRDVVRTQQLKLDEFDRTQLDQAQG